MQQTGTVIRVDSIREPRRRFVVLAGTTGGCEGVSSLQRNPLATESLQDAAERCSASSSCAIAARERRTGQTILCTAKQISDGGRNASSLLNPAVDNLTWDAVVTSSTEWGFAPQGCQSAAQQMLSNCTCHSTCWGCGYTESPRGADDCISCSAGHSAHLHTVYTDGTGECTLYSKSDAQFAATIPEAVIWEGPLKEDTEWAKVARGFMSAGLQLGGHQIPIFQRLPVSNGRVAQNHRILELAGKGQRFMAAVPAPPFRSCGLQQCRRVVVRVMPEEGTGRPSDDLFTAPNDARALILFIGWEFGELPATWVAKINGNTVNQVWSPTIQGRQLLLASGVSASKTAVVPYGIDFNDPFAPFQGSRENNTDSRLTNLQKMLTSAQKRGMIFLFHGSLLWRKGLDLLLAAYRTEFTAKDNVSLIIYNADGNADEGIQTLLENTMKEMRDSKTAPNLHFVNFSLNRQTVAELYAKADLFVYPSRGEGIGIAAAQAMAFGLPIVSADKGAQTEVLHLDSAYLIPSWRVNCRLPPCNKQATSVFSDDLRASRTLMTWAEFDPVALSRILRDVVNNPRDAAHRGSRGQAYTRRRTTWEKAVSNIATNLHKVTMNFAG